MTTPVALTIAGSDLERRRRHPGRPEDLAALGVYGASAITALTAQNTKGVTGIHAVPADFVTAQIDAVFSDLEVGAVKIGMVAQAASIDAIAAALSRWKPGHIVLDPVMVATSGDRLLAAEAVEALRAGSLMPLASVITPNLPEAAALLDEPVATQRGRDREPGAPAAGAGLPRGPDQGRGTARAPKASTISSSAENTIALAAPRVATRNTHGTGCSLSSAVAAGLAKGEDLARGPCGTPRPGSARAIAAADRFSVGHGHGPIHHFHKFY